MEQEKTNIAALLKDAPRGTKLYSPICGECEYSHQDRTLISVVEDNCELNFTHYVEYVISSVRETEPLLFPSREVHDWGLFRAKWADGANARQTLIEYGGIDDGEIVKNSTGCYYIDSVTMIIESLDGLFDTEKAYVLSTGTELESEEEKQTKFKKGDEVVILNERQTGSTPITHIVEEEADGVVYMDNYRYGMFVGGVALVKAKEQPKFKVGDVVKADSDILGNDVIGAVESIEHCGYKNDRFKLRVVDGGKAGSIDIPIEDTSHLATPEEITKWNKEDLEPNHLHYSTSKRKIIHWFLPFDRIVVRCNDDAEDWQADIFSHYADKNTEYPYKTITGYYNECFPYNDKTAKLIGTTDDYEEEQE